MDLVLNILVAGMFLGFIVFLVGCVIFLAASTFRVKNIDFIWLLVVSFIFLAAYYVYMLFREFFPLPIVYSGFLAQGTIFCFLGFILKGFYKGKKSRTRFLVIICLVFATLSISFGFVQDYGATEWRDFSRVFRTICTHAEIIIAMGWQGTIAIRQYISLKPEPIKPHVKCRYLLFGLSCVVLIVMSVSDLIGTTLAVYAGVKYSVTVLLITSLVLASTIFNYLAWVMPSRLKNYLDRNFSEEFVDETILSEKEIMDALRNRSNERGKTALEKTHEGGATA